MKDLAVRLLEIVDATESALRQIHEELSRRPVLPGGWSRKQLIGHLIDSASNNHQRFVRASLADSLDFPGYDQTGCVQAAAVDQADWIMLVSLWSSYNRYLAHVIAHLRPEKLGVVCRIGSNEPVTLRFLAEDYVRHLVHHLDQIGVSQPVTTS